MDVRHYSRGRNDAAVAVGDRIHGPTPGQALVAADSLNAGVKQLQIALGPPGVQCGRGDGAMAVRLQGAGQGKRLIHKSGNAVGIEIGGGVGRIAALDEQPHDQAARGGVFDFFEPGVAPAELNRAAAAEGGKDIVGPGLLADLDGLLDALEQFSRH